MGTRLPSLVIVAKNNPAVYRQFLANLTAGCSLASSAASVGLPAKSASMVLRRAKNKDAPKEVRKVARDIKTALGRVLGLTEAEVRKMDPKYWLTHGPGRIITNEWNDTPDAGDVNRPAQNNLSSKDITDALIQLYRCGISIDSLIESGQISTLQIGAAPNQPTPIATPIVSETNRAGILSTQSNGSRMVGAGIQSADQTRGGVAGSSGNAGRGYGESSWGQKETNNQKETGQKETHDLLTSASNNPTPNLPNHLPVNRNNNTDNYTNISPPKLLVSNEPTEVIDSIDDYCAPGLKPVGKKKIRITRTLKVPGKGDGSSITSDVSQGNLPVSDEHRGSSLVDIIGSQGAFDDHPLVSLQGSGTPMEIGNKWREGVFSQENGGTPEIRQDAPVRSKKTRTPIEFVHDRNYDGPKIEKVSIMKVDPKSVPVIVPDLPEKKGVNNLPPTNADIARQQHKQKNQEMEEGLFPLETLPDGLREFLSQKGIV